MDLEMEAAKPTRQLSPIVPFLARVTFGGGKSEFEGHQLFGITSGYGPRKRSPLRLFIAHGWSSCPQARHRRVCRAARGWGGQGSVRCRSIPG